MQPTRVRAYRHSCVCRSWWGGSEKSDENHKIIGLQTAKKITPKYTNKYLEISVQGANPLLAAAAAVAAATSCEYTPEKRTASDPENNQTVLQATSSNSSAFSSLIRWFATQRPYC